MHESKKGNNTHDNGPCKITSQENLTEDGISYGACILAIAKLSDDQYIYMHITPGNMFVELKGLLDQSIEVIPCVVIYQHNITGKIEDIYDSGIKFNKKDIKLFSRRDRDLLNY